MAAATTTRAEFEAIKARGPSASAHERSEGPVSSSMSDSRRGRSRSISGSSRDRTSFTGAHISSGPLGIPFILQAAANKTAAMTEDSFTVSHRHQKSGSSELAVGSSDWAQAGDGRSMALWDNSPRAMQRRSMANKQQIREDIRNLGGEIFEGPYGGWIRITKEGQTIGKELLRMEREGKAKEGWWGSGV